jgi:hypothetical protein
MPRSPHLISGHCGAVPVRVLSVGALPSTTIQAHPIRLFAQLPRTASALLALFVLGGCAAAPRTRADAASRFPAPVAAAWATAGRTAAGSNAPDTALWVLRPNGRVEHREVRLRMRDGVPTRTERLQLTAFWWREARRGDAGRDTSWVICTSQRPSRNRQCGRVTVDSVPDTQRGGTRRRLSWDGLTFRQQHWTFLAR